MLPSLTPTYLNTNARPKFMQLAPLDDELAIEVWRRSKAVGSGQRNFPNMSDSARHHPSISKPYVRTHVGCCNRNTTGSSDQLAIDINCNDLPARSADTSKNPQADSEAIARMSIAVCVRVREQTWPGNSLAHAHIITEVGSENPTIIISRGPRQVSVRHGRPSSAPCRLIDLHVLILQNSWKHT